MAGDGTELGFPADEFRDAIRTAMQMGSPNAATDKATFRWEPSVTVTPRSPSGRPYDWTAAPTADLTHEDVTLDEVAVEYAPARQLAGTAPGTFVPLRAELTVLDEEYAQVRGANLVLLHGVEAPTVWLIVAETETALFSVDVYTLHLERQ